MDLIHRAVDILDRAQGHVTVATRRAADLVLHGRQVAALEARRAELRSHLDRDVSELGKLTYHRWKNGGRGDDSALTSLCGHIDAMNAEYHQVLAEIADAKALLRAPGFGPSGARSATAVMSPWIPASAGMVSSAPAQPQEPRLPSDTALQPSPAPVEPMQTCAECSATFASSSQYCPSCGMRV
jgi:hypothetical protein